MSLETPELERLVADLAAEPGRWRQHVRHNAARRQFHRLWRDDEVAVWLICWLDGHDTGFHDHDVSAGAVAVVEGAVSEERLVLGGPPAARVATAGDVFSFSAADIHRVRHAGRGPATTIHAYSPPLLRMGAYQVGADGRLVRHSMLEDEELTVVA